MLQIGMLDILTSFRPSTVDSFSHTYDFFSARLALGVVDV